MPPLKRPRPRNDYFDAAALVEALSPMASLKTSACPIDWELMYYAKSKKSQSPDRQGMEKYLPPIAHRDAICAKVFPKPWAAEDGIH